VTSSDQLLADLGGGRWERANRELLAKVLTELWFEEVLWPEPLDGRPADDDADGPPPDDAAPRPYRARLGELEVRFTARWHWMGQHRVDPESVVMDGSDAALPDVPDLLAVVGPALGMQPSTIAGAIAELTNTLTADVHQLATGLPADAVADLPAERMEGQMRGHPWIVANKGRIGFDLDDRARYAPEAQHPFGLRWLAARGGRADYQAWPGLSNEQVVREQLGEGGWSELRRRLDRHGDAPGDVTLVPVHPWQWRQRVAVLHAADLASGALVDLGELGPDGPRYLPQQSIRTLVDVDHPQRRYVKVALSILNTSVYRGIPRARALVAPMLSRWFCGLVADDPYLRETGLVLLGEVASASVAHPAFEAVPQVPYQHTEMLGCIWREPVDDHLAPGERAIPMTALLHRDPAGVSVVEVLVERSGLDVGAWVDRLHEISLPPLAHVLYRYGAAFSPHAQNCMVVLRDDVPVRLVVKDFVDDAMVSSDPIPELADLPADVADALGGGLEAMLLTQWVQGGLLVCVHRYLAEILSERTGLPERRFWQSAATALSRYQARFADELAGRYALFELDAPAFVKLCLNRVRMLERGYDDDAERPIASASGWIDNPLALFTGEGSLR
jgi:siderophore synthetase component